MLLLSPIAFAILGRDYHFPIGFMDLNTYLNEAGSGAAASLAKKINVAPVIISQWKTGRRPIPVRRCPDIEKATGGVIRCEDLRPDVDWAVIRRISIHSSVQQNQP